MSARKAPFTSFEKEYFMELLMPYIDVLDSKRTDADHNRKKAEIWTQIANEFNTSPRVHHATSQQLKKLWLNMKTRAGDAKIYAKLRSHSGGGPYVPDMDPDNESEVIMMPHFMSTTTLEEKDHDGSGELHAEDDDGVIWLPKKEPKEEKKTKRKTCGGSGPSMANIDDLNVKLTENDIKFKEAKHDRELKLLNMKIAHESKINDLKCKLLLLEHEHKKALYEIELKKARTE